MSTYFKAKNHLKGWFAKKQLASCILFQILGFCLFLFFQKVQFNTTFYASPVVLVSVHHLYNPQVSMKSLVSPNNNIISAWVEVNKQYTSFLLLQRAHDRNVTLQTIYGDQFML